jgi:hypothetical protein
VRRTVSRPAGQTAEWHLPGVIERHAHLTYLLAGSRTALIQRMVSDPGRAFYKLLDVLCLGPMADDLTKRSPKVSVLTRALMRSRVSYR